MPLRSTVRQHLLDSKLTIRDWKCRPYRTISAEREKEIQRLGLPCKRRICRPLSFNWLSRVESLSLIDLATQKKFVSLAVANSNGVQSWKYSSGGECRQQWLMPSGSV